jgi:nucleotide-binding universal stress UspA family protein
MFERVLVALDGAAYSQAVMPTAIEVARKFGARLFVLHVVEHDRGRAAVFSTESPAEATRFVSDALETARIAGIAATAEVFDIGVGHVANAIVEIAAANEIDLIVMGSRGLSDVQSLLLGSVTHKVMQLARAAVLVARAPIPVTDREEQPAKVGMAFATA